VTRYWLLCIVYGVAALIMAVALVRSASRDSARASRIQLKDDSTTS
jgi:hypothetical protein